MRAGPKQAVERSEILPCAHKNSSQKNDQFANHNRRHFLTDKVLSFLVVLLSGRVYSYSHKVLC